MKKLKVIISIFLITLISLTQLPVCASTLISDDSELNWYFVARGKGNLPEGAKESISFIGEYDAHFLGKTDKKVLYLTFDEGYENGNTNTILDILKEEQVPAAFFVVKPYLKTCPDIIKRMESEGHLVCNHTDHHPSMAKITDTVKFTNEFTAVEEEYKNITGKDMPKFFRPPMGKYSKNSLNKTKNLGYKTIFWSFAYRDWLIDDQPTEEFAIKKITNGAHPGAIMLLHAVSNTNTKVLKEVIQTLKAEGYEFKSLEELT